MKYPILFFWILVDSFMLCLCSLIDVEAQVLPDNTLPQNSRVIKKDNLIKIEGGSQRGQNLFHSFNSFSIIDNQTAHFNNSLFIKNIFSRVTSNKASMIDGTLKTNGTANLFFINPNGIIFGRNSSLETGGSFFGSTASSIIFDDNARFNTINPTQSLLTISAPIGLQFEKPSQAIRYQSTITQGLNEFVNPINRGLQVPDGKTLALLGGSVDVSGGLIFADKGNIELGSLNQGEQVRLVTQNQGWKVDYSNTLNFQDILFSERALVRSNGGDIQIRGKNVGIIGDAQIVSVATLNPGGDVFLNASQSLIMRGADTRLGTESIGTGDAGDVTVEAREIFISEGAFIDALPLSSGDGGDLKINANDLVELRGTSPDGSIPSGLFAEIGPQVAGNSGNLSIKTRKLRIIDGSQVSVVNSGLGDAGNIFINASDFVEIVQAKRPEVVIPTGIFAQVISQGDGGGIFIKTQKFTLLNGAQVSTGIFGSGKGGDISIKALDSVRLVGSAQFLGREFSSGLFSLVEFEGTGDAGNISVEAKQISTTSGAQITTSSRNIGNAGSISLKADSILFSGAGIEKTSGAFVSAQPGSIRDAGELKVTADDLTVENYAQLSAINSGIGNGGIIAIDVDILNIRDGGRVRATSLVTENAPTNNRGPGGSIMINASSSVNISGSTTFANQVINSTLSTEAQGTGRAGDITVNTSKLLVNNGGTISVSTLESGKAGEININANNLVFLSGEASGVFANTTGQGRGGDISVITDQFHIQDNATIDTRTTASGIGGNIFIKANRFEATQNGRLLTTTAGKKRAGNITLEIRDDLILKGQGSGLFANTGPNSSGPGGNIFIDPRTVSILNGAGIAVDSQGSGIGGNIFLEAGRLNLSNQAFISAETLNSQGGNIRLNIANLLLLQGRSNITATAGRNQNSGDGGNIDINALLIAAFPDENSDISANAFTGRGGNVTINTQGLFGLEARDEPTPLSDITASSEFGFSGEVTLNTPETDPDQGLVDLPTGLVRPQINQRCSPGAPVESSSSFINSGRGGLPPTKCAQ